MNLRARFNPIKRPCWLYNPFYVGRVATGLVLGGNEKFHSRAKTVVNIIIDTANNATETIYNTTGAMRGMSINLEVSNGSSQASGFLISTSQKLDSQAAQLSKTSKRIPIIAAWAQSCPAMNCFQQSLYFRMSAQGFTTFSSFQHFEGIEDDYLLWYK